MLDIWINWRNQAAYDLAEKGPGPLDITIQYLPPTEITSQDTIPMLLRSQPGAYRLAINGNWVEFKETDENPQIALGIYALANLLWGKNSALGQQGAHEMEMEGLTRR